MLGPYIGNVQIDKNITRYIKDLRRHVNGNKDAVVAVTGYRGVGKTLLTMLLSFLYKNSLSWEDLILIPSQDNVKASLDRVGKGHDIILDEAIRSTYKMDFMTGALKYLYQRFQRERKFNRVVWLLQPAFHDFAKGFRDEIINSWIHIYEAGRAIVFSRFDSRYSIDRWMLEEPKKDIAKMVKKGTAFGAEAQIDYDLNLPNAVYYIEFPEAQYKELFVKSGIEAEYEKRSKEANLTAEDQYTPNAGYLESKQFNAIKNAATVLTKVFNFPATQAGQILGYSRQAILNMMAMPLTLQELRVPRGGVAEDMKKVIVFYNERLKEVQKSEISATTHAQVLSAPNIKHRGYGPSQILDGT